MKEPIIIYGAGGLGKEVLSLIRAMNVFEPVGFIDDGLRRDSEVKGLKVLGGVDTLNVMTTPVNLVLAVGDPSTKAMLIKKMIDPSRVYFPTLIHPSAIIQDVTAVSLAAGTIICAGCVLTTDIAIGNHVLLNLNTTVGHDVTIGDYASVMTGVNIAGNVKVGEGVMIGSGASIINNTSVGKFAKVGMGAVVIEDVDPQSTVVGVPARKV